MLDKSGLVTIITEIDNEHFGTKGKLSGQVTENIQLIWNCEKQRVFQDTSLSNMHLENMFSWLK